MRSADSTRCPLQRARAVCAVTCTPCCCRAAGSRDLQLSQMWQVSAVGPLLCLPHALRISYFGVLRIKPGPCMFSRHCLLSFTPASFSFSHPFIPWYIETGSHCRRRLAKTQVGFELDYNVHHHIIFCLNASCLGSSLFLYGSSNPG